MIRVEDIGKQWMECELCGSRHDVKFIIFGEGSNDKRIKLCQKHRRELKEQL